MKRILTMTTALTFLGSAAAMAAPVPDVLWPVPEVASKQNVSGELRDLGFNNIMDYDHSGNVIEAVATWEGEFVALRIDEDTGRITQRETPRVQRLNLTANATEAAMVEALEDRGYVIVGEFEEREPYYMVEVERLNTPSFVYIEPESGYYFDSALVDRPYVPVVADWKADYVRTQLRDLGYRDIKIESTGGAFVTAEAMRYGTPVEITIDKYNGAVYAAS